MAGVPLHWLEVAAPAGVAPVLYLHGVPTDSEDFRPFLERTGGLAPDLPGFGRSGKSADFDYSIDGYARFLDAFLDQAGSDRFSLVVHDWGGVGLALAQRAPERLERLVIINTVPLFPGYRPHRLARLWARAVIGELAMGFMSRRWLRRVLSDSETGAGSFPPDALDRVSANFDHGTQRAILKLHRATSPAVLARAGDRLADITCRTLIVWGTADPYLPSALAHRYADLLGGPTRLELVEGAGHWPWLKRPSVVDQVVDFLLADALAREDGQAAGR